MSKTIDVTELRKREANIIKNTKEVLMKKIVMALVMSGAIGAFPLMAQEKKEMPMKREGMQGGGMMMGETKEMQGRMGEMRKGNGSDDERSAHDEE